MNIKEYIIKNKKIISIILLLLIVSIIVIYGIISIFNRSNESYITYDEILEHINNKDNFIIYYYNSKSKNSYGKKVLKELKNNNINYYIYDDKNIDKEEFNNFLKLLDIDEKLFGSPAFIYIRDGEMYSNLISINNMDSFNKYIQDYDLVMIK